MAVWALQWQSCDGKIHGPHTGTAEIKCPATVTARNSPKNKQPKTKQDSNFFLFKLIQIR